MAWSAGFTWQAPVDNWNSFGRGVLFHPGAYENLFVSFAHTETDVEQTLVAARAALTAMKA